MKLVGRYSTMTFLQLSMWILTTLQCVGLKGFIIIFSKFAKKIKTEYCAMDTTFTSWIDQVTFSSLGATDILIVVTDVAVVKKLISDELTPVLEPNKPENIEEEVALPLVYMLIDISSKRIRYTRLDYQRTVGPRTIRC